MPDEVTLDVSFDDASPAEPVEEPFSISREFLHEIPEQDRPIVQKYITDWDTKASAKFTELQEKLKPWEQYQDPEEVQRAHNFYTHFRSNGEQMLGNMVKAFFEHYGPEEAPQRLNQLLGVQLPVSDPQTSEVEGTWDYSQGEPDPRDVQIQNMATKLEEFEAWKAEQDQAHLEAELDKQVDGIVQAVHTTRTDIPERFILQGIAAGAPPEQIISFYDEIRSSGNQQQSRPNPPPVMGGQGGMPSGQVDVTKLTPQQRRALVAQALEAHE